MRTVFRWSFVLLMMLMAALPAFAQDNTCPALVEQAVAALDSNCGTLDRNTACYGFNRVDATFFQAMSDDFFSTPSDRAGLIDIQSLQTAPLQPEIEQWGVAVMNLQANVPGTLPGQAVRFVLMGDAQIENAVQPDEAFIADVEPIEITVAVNANVRSAPSTNANVVGGASAGQTFLADALSADQAWVRITFNEAGAWISRGVLNTGSGLDALPVLQAEQRTPMQAFYFRTGVGAPICEAAPPSLMVIQGPQRVKVDLSINGANVTIGSTIVLTQTEPGKITLIVLDGAAYLENGLSIPTGFAVDMEVDEDGNFTGVWNNARVLTQEELDMLKTLEQLPLSILNYGVNVPTMAEIQALLNTILAPQGNQQPPPEGTQEAGENPDEGGEPDEPGESGNAPVVVFDAFPTTFKLGECITLTWSVTGATSVFLDGAPVDFSGSASRCPSETTTYILRVVDANNNQKSYGLIAEIDAQQLN